MTGKTYSGVGNKTNDGKTVAEPRHRRNKTENSLGEPYENRKGRWTELDRAQQVYGKTLYTWLTVERCEAELSLLNSSGKRGRPYAYPPSLIRFLILLKEDNNHSYRRSVAHNILDNLGLDTPSYSTVHKSEEHFFKDGHGYNIMAEAGVILASKGIRELFDPCSMSFTGVRPAFAAPDIAPICEAEVQRQSMMDGEAEELRDMMETAVFRRVVGDGTVHVAAVDGSGVGVSGPGIYLEHIWKVNDRRFIKQHVLLDVHSKEVLAFAVTLEKPGDSAMFVPLLEGAVKAGVSVGCVYADSAYDSTANWKFAEENGMVFVPNLKKRFGKNRDLPERNAQLETEEAVGKKQSHILTGYNIRWLVEVFFSVIKKLYGEKIRNRLFDRMVLTVRARYDLYMMRQGCINAVRDSAEQ